jgi:hypothetical protein
MWLGRRVPMSQKDLLHPFSILKIEAPCSETLIYETTGVATQKTVMLRFNTVWTSDIIKHGSVLFRF